MIRIIIIAGETSGDEYGAKLMQALNAKYNNQVEFWGIGGPEMMGSGLNQLEDINNVSVVGFSEAVKKLPYIAKLLNRIALFIIELNPADIILIDFPGFNLSLAKNLKKKNFSQHITYFISPQIWAWNERRIKKIKKYINKMLVIFPFEELYYRERGVDATFIGHPFLDQWTAHNKNSIKKELGFNNEQTLVGIFPGSRAEEIIHHLPTYIQAYHQIRTTNPHIKFALGLAPSIDLETITTNYNTGDIQIIENNSLKLLECVDAAIVTSGTISLQAAFMLTPCVVGYKLSKISWFISQFLVKIKFIAMANIIANKMIYKELLQNELNAQNIANEIHHIVGDKEYTDKMFKELGAIKNEFLIKSNAIENASQIIYDNINA